MNWKKVVKVSLLLAPTFIVLNHDFYSITRIKGSSLSPTFNPHYNKSSGIIEDDYVLIKILGDAYDPNIIKQKFVRVVNPDNSKSIKKVECIEGEWCPSPFGFTYVQSGHAWVKTYEDEGSTTPLALIDGLVEKTIWPPDRYDCFNMHKENKHQITPNL